MSGFYLMHRGWMDNPALGGAREPFCRRAAWAWLIEEAAWRDTRANVGGKWVDLKRGQMCHAYRHLADQWGWSLAGVQRFIDRLVTDTMVERTVINGRMVLTICKYEEYQIAGRIGGDGSDTPSDTRPIRDRYATDTKKKEGNKGKEGKKERGGDSAPVADAPAAPTDPAPSPAGDLFSDPPSPPPAEPKPPKASRLDAGWILPVEWRDWAAEKGASPDAITREAEKFRDHWLAKAGADARKADWYATWRNWMRRSLDTTRPGDRNGSHHPHRGNRDGRPGGWAAAALRETQSRH